MSMIEIVYETCRALRMCCNACCLAELDSSDKTILDKDGRDVFLPPEPGLKTEAELQKLPVNEAPPSVDPLRVPRPVGIGLFGTDAAPVPGRGTAAAGAPEIKQIII